MAMSCPNCQHPVHFLDRLRRRYPCPRCNALLKSPDHLHRISPTALIYLVPVITASFVFLFLELREYISHDSAGFILYALTATIILLFIRWRFCYQPELESTIAGYCMKCGYDMTGNRSKRCPECGTAYVYNQIKERESA